MFLLPKFRKMKNKGMINYSVINHGLKKDFPSTFQARLSSIIQIWESNKGNYTQDLTW